MTISWPDVLVPRNCSPPELRNAARGGGATYAGTEQRVYSDAGRWEFNLQVPVRTRGQQLAWRAMMARLREGEDILLKVFDRARAISATGLVHQASMAASAAARATTLHIYTINLALEPGVHFSLGQRLYRVKQVTAATSALSISDWLTTGSPWDDGGAWIDAPIDGAAEYTVTITPPLRDAVAMLDPVECRDLVCLAYLPDATSGDLELDLGKFGTPSLKLAEA